MMRLFEVLTWIGAIIGAIILLGGLSISASAPQEAAAAAMAVAMVAIPYCVLGMLQRRQMLKELAHPKLMQPLD
jgi:hypothetical protein